MKKIFVYFPITLILLFIISCSGKKVEQRVAKIDSLTKIIDSVDQKLTLINKDTVKNRYSTYKKTIDTIAKHMKELRTDESWKYICAYQEVRKPFKTLTFNYDIYKAEIDSSVRQLANLKHDIKAKLLSDKEFEIFFKNECNSVNAVYFKVSKNIETVSRQMKNYDTVHPYLIKLINDHKQGKKNHK
jgi:hypothetical protein